jgi:hypothetical protein
MPLQIVVKTDQTGANNPVNIGQSRTFNFQLFTGYDLWAAEFSMKKGSSSIDGVTATIYKDFNGTGDQLTQIPKLVGEFAQSFTTETYDFSSVGTLSIGKYSLILTSASPAGGSTDYFIKDGNARITDTDGTTVIATFDSEGNQIDGNNELMDGGTINNGSAEEQWYIPATGGSILTGGHENFFEYTVVGGAIIGGAAEESAIIGGSANIIAEGGAIIGGTADLGIVYSQEIAGGVIASGSSSNVFEETSIGGSIASGQGVANEITIHTETGSGGAILGGDSMLTTISQESFIGGVIVTSTATEFIQVVQGGIIISGTAKDQHIAKPTFYFQKRTAIFEVDLTPAAHELVGPLSNQKRVAVYHPHEDTNLANQQDHRSMWIPGLSSVHGRNMKHKERVVVHSGQIKYVTDMFTSINGPPISGMELLKLVEGDTVVPRGFYPPVKHQNEP